MANAVYNIAKSGMMNGTIDLDTHDIRILLVKTGSLAETQIDADTIATITTLSEVTVAGYARQALVGEAVTTDDTNDRGSFTANTVTFTALAAGETVLGALIFRFVTADADHIPICFLDLTDTPTNGGDIVLTFTNGILRGT